MKRKTFEESYVVFGRVYYGFEPTESHFFSAFRCTLVLRHHQRGRKLFVTFQRSSVNIILPRVCPRFMKMYALEKSWISYEKFKETLYWKTRRGFWKYFQEFFKIFNLVSNFKQYHWQWISSGKHNYASYFVNYAIPFGENR